MRVVAAAGIRPRWRSLLLLTFALGLTGAVVLASLAGSRRGRDALDEFLDYHRPGNVEAFVDPSLPVRQQEEALARIVAAAGDVASVEMAALIVALPGPDGIDDERTDRLVAEAHLNGVPMDDLNRVLLLDGELPLEPGEVAVNDFLAGRRGLEVGEPLQVAVFAREDLDRVGNGEAVAPVDEAELNVGAIIRTPFDLARSPQSQPGTLYESEEARVVLEPSFWAEHGGDLAFYGLGAALEIAPRDREATLAAMTEAAGDEGLVSPVGSEDLAKLGPVGDAIDLQANALLALAAVVLVFGLAVLGAAAARAAREDESARDALHALGLTNQQVNRVTLLRGAGLAVAATAMAVVGAVALSPLFPIGLAREADLDPGLEVDPAVLGVGGAAFFLLLFGRLVLATRTDRVGAQAARSPTAVPLTPAGLGVRLVTDGLGQPGRGASRAAMAAAIAGTAAVVAAATFAASLDHLVADHRLQGWTWDLVVGNYSDPETAEAGRRALVANPDVERFSAYQWSTVRVDGHDVTVAEFDADAVALTPTVLEGRAPQGDDEIALGRDTLADLDKEIGDTVAVSATTDPVEATIVGVVVAPATVVFPMDLDSGATTTFDLIRRVFADQPNSAIPAGYLVDIRDDVGPAAALDRLQQDFGGTVLGPMEPLDLADLQRVRTVPYLLAALLGGLALVSTVVSLSSLGRRRRRDVAVLRALGLARGQLRRLVGSEATTFLALALAIGVPVGVAGGQRAWSLAADGLGSEVGPLVPVITLVVAAAALLLAVNLYGQVLATVVGRRHPGRDLHAE